MKNWQTYIVTRKTGRGVTSAVYTAKTLPDLIHLVGNVKTAQVTITPIPPKPKTRKH